MKQKLQKSCISEDGSQEEIREPEQQTNTHSFPTPAGDADADEGQQKRQQEEADHDVEWSADEYSIRSTRAITTTGAAAK